MDGVLARDWGILLALDGVAHENKLAMQKCGSSSRCIELPKQDRGNKRPNESSHVVTCEVGSVSTPFPRAESYLPADGRAADRGFCEAPTGGVSGDSGFRRGDSQPFIQQGVVL